MKVLDKKEKVDKEDMTEEKESQILMRKGKEEFVVLFWEWQLEWERGSKKKKENIDVKPFLTEMVE